MERNIGKPLRTRWVVSGIIEAPTEKVWEALLDVIPNLSTVEKNTVALEDGPVHFTTPIGEPPVGKMHVEIDKKRHIIAIQGEWWYRGEHQVEPHEQGSLLTYRVYNIAPGVTRWLVPLMQRRLGTQMKNNLQGLLHTISDRLDCTTSLITE